MKKLMCLVCLLSLTVLIFAQGSLESNTYGIPISDKVIEIEGGLIKGVPSDTEGVTVYKGVPFAAPPVGELRWKAPQVVTPWDGIKTCDTWPAMPAQDKSGNKPGVSFYGDEFYFDSDRDVPVSEDCLYMNIFVPNGALTEKNAKYPVYFYTHGGGNDHGFASKSEFNASKMAEKGIIVVVTQYRLGAFGFLALPELTAENGFTGNFALLDLIKGLEWVNQNIAAFGGDKDNVTIGGQSAGCMNTRSLLSSSLADGLYNRAILQSGFSSDFTSYKPLAIETAYEASRKSIDTTFGKGTTIEDLRAMDASAFLDINVIKSFIAKSKTAVLDEVVLKSSDLNLIESKRLDNKQIIIGGTSNEMTGLVGVSNKLISKDDFYNSLKKTFTEDFCSNYNLEEVFPFNEGLQANADLLSVSSISFLMNTRRNMMNTAKDFPCYVYFFDQDLPPHKEGTVNRDESVYGAFHSSELWYTFNSLRNQEGQRIWTKNDFILADTISNYWVNFIKTGNPNGENLSGWPTCTELNDGTYMSFNNGKAVPSTRFTNNEKELFFRNSLKWEN